MTKPFLFGSAQRLPRSAVELLERDQVERRAARKEAQRIIHDAQQKARAIKQAALEEWDQHDKRMRSIASDQLDTFIDHSRLESSAAAVLSLADASRMVRDDFEEMSPWLVDLVRVLLTNVLGELGPEEKWTRLITQGLEAMESRWDLVLHCHPSQSGSSRAFCKRAQPSKRRSVR